MLSLTMTAVLMLGAEGTSAQTPLHEFNNEISALFKQEAAAKDLPARAAPIRQMCALHARIVSDERYATSDKLKEYRARLWSRLKKVRDELKREIARESDGKETTADLDVLESADELSVAAAESLADSLSLSQHSQGGAANLLSFGGDAISDNGRELVELIQRTINPAFWDVVGGPGTIVYYAPLQCIVVRATSEIHGNVGGALGGLREAGK